jgi:hypothetical protein
LESNNIFQYYLCAGVAGLLACIPTCPLDVIKTKLNTQNCVESVCHKYKMCSMLNGNHPATQSKINSNYNKKKFPSLFKHAISTKKLMPF